MVRRAQGFNKANCQRGKLFFSIDLNQISALPSGRFMARSGSTSRVAFSRLVQVFRLLLLVAFLTLLPGSLDCQTHVPKQPKPPKQQKLDGRHQIDALEEAWRVAMLHADGKAMGALLSDDYIGITPTGTIQTREQALEKLGNGKAHINQLSMFDRKVRFYARTAVVTSRAYIQGSTPEGDLLGNYRYTRVYVKGNDNVWKIVSFEASRMRVNEKNP